MHAGACCIKCYELKHSVECYVSLVKFRRILRKRSILSYVSIRNILYNRPQNCKGSAKFMSKTILNSWTLHAMCLLQSERTELRRAAPQVTSPNDRQNQTGDKKSQCEVSNDLTPRCKWRQIPGARGFRIIVLPPIHCK